MGRSSSRRSKRVVVAPASAAPSSATRSAARLRDARASEPPRPTILSWPVIPRSCESFLCPDQVDAGEGAMDLLQLAALRQAAEVEHREAGTAAVGDHHRAAGANADPRHGLAEPAGADDADVGHPGSSYSEAKR